MPDGYFGSLPIPYNVKADPNSLAEEIAQLDSEKANKTTTINGKSLEEDRVIYAQDVPSKNLLPNTASTQTINGVTFTVNSDGSISTSGTASADISYTFITLTQAEASQYSGCILSGCPSGGADSSYYFKMQRNGSPWTGYGTDYGNGVTLATIDAQAYIFIGVKSGTNMNGKTFRPMIRLASIEDDSYVPYSKDTIELTKDSISLLSKLGTFFQFEGVAYVSAGGTGEIQFKGEGVHLLVGKGSFGQGKYAAFIIGYANWDSNRTAAYPIVTAGGTGITLGNTTTGYGVRITNGYAATMDFALYKLL